MSTSGPSAVLLRDWVTGSLRLTARTVAALSDDGPDVPAPRLEPDKVVGEALLLLRATADVGAGRADPDWRRLYAAAAPLARPASVPAAICCDPAHALEAAFCHLQLSALGDTDPGIDLLLDLALAEPDCGPEPYVVTALHRAWLRGLCDEGPDLAGVAALLERSSLGRQVDVLRCSTQDVYDLTHAVMHGTDLGRWRIPVPRPEADLVPDLDALLALALDARNLDLTTELLWCWPMLGLAPSPARARALDEVASVRADQGFLPGPGFEREVHALLAPQAQDAYVLRTSYHASLVLGILGASMLAAGPPRGAPTQLDGGLAALDLTVALRNASDRSDLQAVRGLLELALELDLAEGRAVQQAASLLRRSAAMMSPRAAARLASS
jgi:hypothetical protein